MELKEIKCRNCGSVNFMEGKLNGVGPNLECVHCGTMYVFEPELAFAGIVDYDPNDFMCATSRTLTPNARRWLR